jgi:EmrB/QacA subfamily drug resistance transporter
VSTATAEAAEGLALHTPKGRLALAATVAASAMASLDATVVNVAIPDIGRDLDAGVSALQWVLTGYLLSLASLILLGGALGDRIGRRKVFVIGTVWFAVASALCGAATSIEMLVVARILQGVGGALLTPGSLAILQASFRQSDRAKAVGAWSGLLGVAGAIGPFVGGGLVDGPGWRWAFLLNLPVAVATIVMTRASVPETRDTHPTSNFDVLGVVLAVAGLAAATWALTEAGPRGWSHASVVVTGAVGVAAVIGFVTHILRTDNPLVPPQLFRNRSFSVINVMTVQLYAAIGVAFFLVAYELQVAAEWSALEAGAALIPTTLLMLALSARSGALGQKIGPRPQLVAGPLLSGAGLLLLARIGPDASWAVDVLPGSVLFGVGLVTFVAPLTATVMASADPDHVSVASGINNAIARTASLGALALVPVVAGLASASDPSEVTDAFRVAMVIAAAMAASAALPALFGLERTALATRTARRVHCQFDGPPLQADPERCPMSQSE